MKSNPKLTIRPNAISAMYAAVLTAADEPTDSLLEQCWEVFVNTADSRLARQLLLSGKLTPERADIAVQYTSSRQAISVWNSMPHVTNELFLEICQSSLGYFQSFRAIGARRHGLPIDFYVNLFEDERGSHVANDIAANTSLPTELRLWAFSFVVRSEEILTLPKPLAPAVVSLANLVATFPVEARSEMQLDREGVIFALADVFGAHPKVSELSSSEELLSFAADFFNAIVPLTSDPHLFRFDSDLEGVLHSIFTHRFATSKVLSLLMDALDPYPAPANIYALVQPSREVFETLLKEDRLDLFESYISDCFQFDSFSDRTREIFRHTMHRDKAEKFFLSLLPKLEIFEEDFGKTAFGLRKALAESEVVSWEVVAPLTIEELTGFPESSLQLVWVRLTEILGKPGSAAWDIFETLANDGQAPLQVTALAARKVAGGNTI